MRIGGLLLLAWALSASAPARADSVVTGAPQKVVRERVVDRPQMVFVEPRRDAIGPAEVTLIGVVGELHGGDEYDVVDDGGFAAHVRVASVARTSDRCPGFAYQRARALIGESHHDIDAARAVAVGPAIWPRRAAQLISWNAGDVARSGMPPPGLLSTLIHLVDLDGDRVPDLARYLYQCSGGEAQAWSGRGAACLEDWARAVRGWRVTARSEFTCE